MAGEKLVQGDSVNTLRLDPETNVVVKPKTFYLSLTLIFNALVVVLGLLNQFTDIHFIQLLVHDPVTAQKVADLLVALIALINVILRFRTTQPLTLKK